MYVTRSQVIIVDDAVKKFEKRKSWYCSVDHLMHQVTSYLYLWPRVQLGTSFNGNLDRSMKTFWETHSLNDPNKKCANWIVLLSRPMIVMTWRAIAARFFVTKRRQKRTVRRISWCNQWTSSDLEEGRKCEQNRRRRPLTRRLNEGHQIESAVKFENAPPASPLLPIHG